MRHFLQYWRMYSHQYEFNTPLNFAASAQFTRLRPRDMLWIVAIIEGRLTLLGRLAVDRVVNRESAIKELGTDVYDAPLCAIAVRETVRNIVEVDIQPIAAQLRFASVKDRLRFAHPDSTDGKQLQTMRELTTESAAILEKLLESKT